MTLHSIFDDAHRRVCIAKSKIPRPPRERIWTGLAFPREMKKAVELRFMKPVSHETPGILCWYTFTSEGWDEYDKRYQGKPDWFDQ